MFPVLPPLRRTTLRAARVTLLAAALLSTVAGCQTPPRSDPAALRRAVEAVNRQFMDAFARKDAVAMGQLYAEDALALPPGAVEVGGRAAIEAMWRSFMALPISQFELKTAEVDGNGDTAWEFGRYRMLQNDGSVADAGKYVVIWKMTGTGWKAFREIWNSDAPTASPVPAEASPPR